MSEFRRQHPVAAITQLLSLFRQNVVPIVVFAFLGARNEDNYFWYFLGAGVLLAAFSGVAGWFRFTFRVHEDELQIKKGIFVRKQLYLSRDRIQVIDITEGIIQRIFGLVKVEVKTAGSGTESATISAITYENALKLRSLLRNGSADQAESENEVSTKQEEKEKETYPVWRLSPKRLLYAALTSGNFGLIASILGAISGQLDQFINEENLNYIFDHIPGFGNTSVLFGLIIVILVVSYIFSFVGVILKYADFKLEKREEELHIQSGLLERKHITIPFNRIQAVRFVEGILRQPFGFGMVYVESAGFEQQNKEKSIVLFPLMRKSELEKYFGEYLPDYEDEKEVTTPPERAFWRYLRRPNYLVLAGALALWYVWEYGWILFFLLIPFTILGWLRYMDASVTKGKNTLILKYRVLARHTAFIKRNRVQVSESTINPFQKRKLLSTIKVTAASGAGGRSFKVEDMEKPFAEELQYWSIPV